MNDITTNIDLLLLSRGGRDIAVKVYLSADEYLALEHLCEQRGEDSHSAYLRRLLKREVAVLARELSLLAGADNSANVGLDRG
jgi:hypothetical protein